MLGQVARLFNGGAAGNADVLPHLRGDNPCQRGFAKARRAVEQQMVQRLVALERRLDGDMQIPLYALLTDVFPQGFGAQALLLLVSALPEARGNDAVVHALSSLLPSHVLRHGGAGRA